MRTNQPQSDLLRRIERLERAVFGNRETKPTKQTYTGATGGLHLLIAKGFFDRRRFFSEIEKELQSQGYHYSRQAIQTPLNRLSALRGPLVSLKEKGKKIYAKRK